MIAKLLLQNLIWVVAMGALLCVPAGALHWPAAWVFLGTIAILGIGGGLWLAKTDPALLAERMRPMMQSDQPEADKKFILDNLTLEEMAQIMGSEQVNLARKEMGLPPLPDHENKDQTEEK